MDAAIDFDAVLAAPPPDFDEAAVIAIAERTFGLVVGAARDLGSERDQTFLLLDDAATPRAVMKLSNAAEDPATLDMEALAVHHAARVDPGLPLALPWRVPAARPAMAIRRPIGRPSSTPTAPTTCACTTSCRVATGSTRAACPTRRSSPGAARRRAWAGRCAGSSTRAPSGRCSGTSSTPAGRGSWSTRSATPIAGRSWSASSTATTAVLEPAWPSLRAQVVHGDLTSDNALTDDAGRITGIVDFGDMSHSALLIDLASVLDSLCAGRGPDELFRTARLVIDGHQRVTPLEPDELRLLGEMWATRAAVTIAISSWRTERGLEHGAFAERYNAAVSEVMATLLEVGWDEVARRFGAEVPRPGAAARAALVARRERTLGPALEPLSYDEPIQMASAEGVWMVDVDGRRYLDAYNNVPCVGHAHPRVTEAIARASRRLNTNLRYLHEGAIELAERLSATMPPGLDTVFFVNSGSEANDLAWRLATTATGASGRPVHTIRLPRHLRGDRRPVARDVAGRATARPRRHVGPPRPARRHPRSERTGRGDRAARGGRPPTGGRDPRRGPHERRLPVHPRATSSRRGSRACTTRGGLWIADEVQGGHGRTGESMWSFERYGITPDFVTLGKPMGNGHPVGAVVTRRDLAERFADQTVFFSTFGGNQVSVAASLAVLDVLADERVLPRVTMAGATLRDALRAVAEREPRIREVRGAGLAIGVAFDGDAMATCRQGGAAGARRSRGNVRTSWRGPQGPPAARVHDDRGPRLHGRLRGDAGGPLTRLSWPMRPRSSSRPCSWCHRGR